MNRNRSVVSAFHRGIAGLIGLVLCCGTLTAQQISASPVEVFTPWSPVPATALGRVHLVYEIHLTNFGAAPLLVHALVTAAAEDSPGALNVASARDVARSALHPGAALPADGDTLRLLPGQRVLLLRWLALGPGQAPPDSLTHRLVLGPPGGPVDTLETPRVPVSRAAGDVLDAPVVSGTWIAIRGPSNSSGHRASLVPLHGSVRVPQRFAVDWARLGDDGRLYQGDPGSPANWYGYGTPVRSATAGTVTLTRDGIPENTPLSPAMAVPIDATTATGNTVVVRDTDGRYVTYAHLMPGSLTVREGDVVRVGDTLGRIGNSGNSLAPHLHFHVSDAPDPLAGEGMPFQLRRFRLVGGLESVAEALHGASWLADPAQPARDVQSEMPLENMVLEIGS